MSSKTKVYEDEIVKDICTQLDKLVEKVIHINPKFVYIGSKEKGYYSIYNENSSNKNRELNLNFRLYYPDKNSFYHDKEAKHLKDNDLNDYIEYKYANSKLLYVKIEWFSVSPRKKGIGSRVISSFIKLLKEVEDVEFILLTPKNDKARSFWSVNKFLDEDFSIKLDKRVKPSACNRLVYKFSYNESVSQKCYNLD